MSGIEYGITDFQYVAAGAAILASGGGGSYSDAVYVLAELVERGWTGTVLVQDYDGATNCCVRSSPLSTQGAAHNTASRIVTRIH